MKCQKGRFFSQGFIDQLATIAELLVLTGKRIFNYLQGLIDDNNPPGLTDTRKISCVFPVNYVVFYIGFISRKKSTT